MPISWGVMAKPLILGSLPIEEEFDLVVVGAGISGLAAACFWQQMKGKQQRILLIDNHDDFGGHAKRNEFSSENGTLLGYGAANRYSRHVPTSAR
ncbi:protoporphyrinogen oxidase [Serratia fonticola]|uniref:Protoporphyrinogen oxidase n=1 Tax=Serratia fonticola TaxID=47917 RepID=A0A4U9WCG0_SERFO|nr:protoporphyrinogen oxidase [Serratia fonticola]